MKITEGRVRLAASDVANFLACRRLAQLDLLRARGELRPPRYCSEDGREFGLQYLYRVVRQGVQAGVENYSIKRLEPVCGYDRRVDLAEATASLIAFEAALEDGTAAGDGKRQQVVAGYNEDDCRATLALRDWLEERRAELAERLGQELPRPVFVEQPGAAEDPETARIRSALLAGVSVETSSAIAWGVSAETREGQARTLLRPWSRRGRPGPGSNGIGCGTSVTGWCGMGSAAGTRRPRCCCAGHGLAVGARGADGQRAASAG
jgi:hypothetical protein